jgi:cephalosporin hydroxylase
MPPAVAVELRDTVRDYWLRRAEQHTSDSYAGIRMSKFPEDLRVYEHLLWSARADVVIEIGVHFGGSALWFRDRLRTAAGYGRIAAGRVIAVDINVKVAREALAAADPEFEREITLVEGDIRDPGLPARVAALVPDGARCLVSEDGAHQYDTTIAALNGFERFVPVGGYFVVEDGCVDIEEMRLRDDWPRGVLPAVREWLAGDDGRRFRQRRDLELYGMTCHPYGFLQRVEAAPEAMPRPAADNEAARRFFRHP